MLAVAVSYASAETSSTVGSERTCDDVELFSGRIICFTLRWERRHESYDGSYGNH